MFAKYSPVVQKGLIDSVYNDCSPFLVEYADEDVKNFRDSLKCSINERLRTVKKTYDKHHSPNNSSSNSNTPAKKKQRSRSRSPRALMHQSIREEGNHDELSSAAANSTSKGSHDDEIKALQEALKKAEEKKANEELKKRKTTKKIEIDDDDDDDEEDQDDDDEELPAKRSLRSGAAATKGKRTR